MGSTIFSGNSIKALKAKLNLADQASIEAGSLDPTITAIDGNIGDVYISNSTGKLYVKAVAGLNTNWGMVDAITAGNGIDITAGVVSVELDGATLTVSGSGLKVTNAGIDTTQLANLAVTNAKVASGLDAVKIADGSISNTEFQYLNGVTGDIQTQLDARIAASQKGASFGVATLDAASKVPVSQLPNSVMEYQGAWNAATNSPTLADGIGNNGDVYRVSVSGSQDLGSGTQSFVVGDFIIYNGTIWQKSPGADAVYSVNGLQGVVVLDTDDIGEGSINLYFTSERAQDAVGDNLLDTASVNLTYNDGTGQISADVLPAGVDHNQLLNYVANQHVDHSSVAINAGTGLTGGGNITASQTIGMPNVGTVGTYGSATQVAQVTTDAQGRVSAASNVSISIAATQVADGSVSNTEFQYLDGVTSAIQTQLNNKANLATGDIQETSISLANNQSSAADVTGLAFANGSVRSFRALVSVTIDATSDLSEVFEINGIQRASDWSISVVSNGDDSLVNFSITNVGQVQYTSSNYSGFVSGEIAFRALVTNI